MNSRLSQFSWTLNRLTTMAPEEVWWRARRALSSRLERLRAPQPAEPPVPQAARLGAPWWDALPHIADASDYRAAADRILQGRYDIFARRDLALGFPPCWSRDPKTGTLAPRGEGKRIQYRDVRVVGDIKYLWEINRHYELVTLAQAAALTGEARYANACRQMLDSWFLDQPWPLGIGWSSALENAIRLVNWAVAWQLLALILPDMFSGEDAASGERFRARWLRGVWQHASFIAANLSLHSSANNHLFGELMGLFIAALVWPCWPESAAWLARARAGLEEEALRQIGPDGVDREQAVWYHHEVAGMMVLCTLFGRANGVSFSPAWHGRLEGMLAFIASVMDAGGNVPMIGDADDAVMVRFVPPPQQECVFRSLLATGAVLFDRPDFKAKAGRFDLRSHWLLGDDGEARFAALAAQPPAAVTRRVFADAGVYVLGDAFDTPEEVRIVADAGPIGYLSIAAHGHADALAFTLSAGGLPFLIDPGTFAYHTEPAWRVYFRGTAAHNTVTVDDADQSEPGGHFMWLRKARTTCLSWHSDAEEDRLVAMHDGYGRLPDPVRHTRTICFRKAAMQIVVEDRLEAQGTHTLLFAWHFDDACDVTVEGCTVIARRGGWQLTMQMEAAPEAPVCVSGQSAPPFGWISRRFDERQPSPSVFWRESSRGTVRRVTVMQLVRQPPGR